MKIFYSPRLLEHDTGGGHPECALRLQAILQYLKDAKLSFTLAEPKPASEKQLSLIHDPRYLDQLAHPSLIKTYFPDNPICEDTYPIAKLAAGAAIGAAHACLKEKFSFALVRPPGHHAGKLSFGGFCYLNNIAAAVASLLHEKKASRILIVDFDVHFGNGTEEIFRDEKRVFYLSLHQDAQSIYPYKGFERDSTYHIKNIELPIGFSDEQFLEKLDKSLASSISSFKPGLIAVSAGFDSYYEDVSCGQVTRLKHPETYRKIGGLIRKHAGGKPVFAVLEGGYFLDRLGENVFNFLSAFERLHD